MRLRFCHCILQNTTMGSALCTFTTAMKNTLKSSGSRTGQIGLVARRRRNDGLPRSQSLVQHTAAQVVHLVSRKTLDRNTILSEWHYCGWCIKTGRVRSKLIKYGWFFQYLYFPSVDQCIYHSILTYHWESLSDFTPNDFRQAKVSFWESYVFKKHSGLVYSYVPS